MAVSRGVQRRLEELQARWVTERLPRTLAAAGIHRFFEDTEDG
jgi:hypothetical protein